MSRLFSGWVTKKVVSPRTRYILGTFQANDFRCKFSKFRIRSQMTIPRFLWYLKAMPLPPVPSLVAIEILVSKCVWRDSILVTLAYYFVSFSKPLECWVWSIISPEVPYVSSSLRPSPSTLITDGSRNILPSNAILKGDTRALSDDTNTAIETHMRQIGSGIASGCQISGRVLLFMRF